MMSLNALQLNFNFAEVTSLKRLHDAFKFLEKLFHAICKQAKIMNCKFHLYFKKKSFKIFLVYEVILGRQRNSFYGR